MTTALATLTGNGKAELTQLEQAIIAELEQETSAYDYIPTRIKFPSGGMSVFSTNDGDVLKPPFTAIVAVSQKARAWWPSKDTAGLPPLCASPDGILAAFYTADKDQTQAALRYPIQHPALSMLDANAAAGPHTCATCPLAQWGSAGERAQACKSLRRLILLVEGWTMPAIMTVPPTSTKIFDAYASARARERGQTYFTAWTRFELEQATNNAGIKYGVLKLAVAKPLTDEETRAVLDIRRQYADLVRSMGIDADDYAAADTASNGRVVDESTGEIIEAAADIPF